DGLAYAHKNDVIHRDIKPENLLIDTEGVVKILDMGLARIDDELAQTESSENHDLTQAGQIMGTINYMAPEQALDTRSADARSDIYSLGCTLFRLLTAQAVFEGDTKMKKLVAHREAPIPSIRKSRRDVPELLDAVFEKMVAKKPDHRYQSMGEVIGGLRAARSGMRTPPDPRSSDQERPLAGPSGPPNTERPILPPTVDNNELSIDSAAATVPRGLAPPPEPPPVSQDSSASFIVEEGNIPPRGEFVVAELVSTPPINAEIVAKPPPAPPPTTNETVVAIEAEQDTSTGVLTNESPLRRSRWMLVSLFGTALLTMVVVLGLLAAFYTPDDTSLLDDDSAAVVGEGQTGGEWVDVQPQIDLSTDCLGAAWTRRDGNLFAPGSSGCRAMIPIAPEGSYELTIELTPNVSNHGLHLLLPTGSSNTMLTLVDETGQYGGLERLNRRDLQFSELRRSAAAIAAGRRSIVQVAVKLNGADVEIDSWVDDTAFVTWRGPQTALSDPGGDWSLPLTSVPGFGAAEETIFHSVRLRPLSGELTPADRTADYQPRSVSAQ
ncbi:MAG: serine/threonine-protein kinase, partial [Planctomycetota bacterium]|nr:serine/threonine-protein kinase [Planctomycetota bacterium]